MEPNAILMPAFALVSLYFIVTARLGYLRLKAVNSGQTKISAFKLMDGGGETPAMRVVSRNYTNLCEAPILFYAIVILYYITMRVDHLAVGFAWGYVVFRYIHTLIHIGPNDVRLRFTAFLVSQFFLIALWVKLWVALFANH